MFGEETILILKGGGCPRGKEREEIENGCYLIRIIFIYGGSYLNLMVENISLEGNVWVDLVGGPRVDFNNPDDLATVTPPGRSYRKMILLADRFSEVPVLKYLFPKRNPENSILHLYDAAVIKHGTMLLRRTDLPERTRSYIEERMQPVE